MHQSIQSSQRAACVYAEVKTTETVGPVLIHIITQKGKGYLPAETASDKMHGVGPYNPKDGKGISKPSSKPKVIAGNPMGCTCPFTCIFPFRNLYEQKHNVLSNTFQTSLMSFPHPLLVPKSHPRSLRCCLLTFLMGPRNKKCN